MKSRLVTPLLASLGLFAPVAAQCELARLLPSSYEAGDGLGSSVSLSGDIALVGASEDDSFGLSSGAAYVFDRQGSFWSETAKLVPSDGAAFDYFGYAVSVSGDTAFVGAYGDDDVGSGAGSAYVFERQGSSWVQTAKLLGSFVTSGASFGISVSHSGDTALIGAPGYSGGRGAVFVFELQGTQWVQTKQLGALDAMAGERFGHAVSLSGDRALIGAFAASASGAAYVFERQGPTWVQKAKLVASDGSTGDSFGWAVALSSSTALVGSRTDDVAAEDSGSAYVFEQQGSAWTQVARLTASDGAGGDLFGTAVAFSAGAAVVGAPYADHAGYNSGSAYLFEKPSGGWVDASETLELTPTSLVDGVYYGTSVALSGGKALIGADVHGLNPQPEGAFLFAASAPCIDAPSPGAAGAFNTVSVTGATPGGLVGVAFAADVGSAPLGAICPGLALDLHQPAPMGFALVDAEGRADVQAFVPPGVAGFLGFHQALDFFTCSVTNVYPHVYSAAQCHLAELGALSPVEEAHYGSSVSIFADTAVVGARQEYDMGTGFAEVFERQGSVWVRTAVLTASDAAVGDLFGSSVFVAEDTILVGAPGAGPGAAYVFERQGAAWDQVARLSPAGPSGDFGSAVSVHGKTALVGARSDGEGGPTAGAVFVFDEPVGGWVDMTETQKLIASDALGQTHLGTSVSLFGDTAIAGASQGTGPVPYSGTVYVFQRGPAGWVERQEISASDAEYGDRFGTGVALFDDIAVIGAPHKDSFGPDSGKAYVFAKQGHDLVEVAGLTAEDAWAGDRFGVSVALYRNLAVVGVEGDDDLGFSSGAVYVFERPDGGWVDMHETKRILPPGWSQNGFLGTSVSLYNDDVLAGAPGYVGPGSAHVYELGPCLMGPSPGVAGSDNTMRVCNATPGGEVLLGFGLVSGSGTLAGVCPGTIVGVTDPTLAGTTLADATGAASFSGPVAPSLSGTTLHFQALDVADCRVSNLVTHTFP